MAQTTTISQKELERQAKECLEGRTLYVMLCEAGATPTTLTAENTVAEWQVAEKAGNGYTRYSEVIGVGSYSTLTNAYTLPAINAEFTAAGSGYSFDSVILYLDGETYIHSFIFESPSISMAPGQTQIYRITLLQDD